MRPNINESSKFKHKPIKHSRNNMLSSSKPGNWSTSKRKPSIKCQNYPKAECISTNTGKLVHTARVNLSQISPNRFQPSSSSKQYGYLGGSHQRINSQRNVYSKATPGGAGKHSAIETSKINIRSTSEHRHRSSSKTGSNKRK